MSCEQLLLLFWMEFVISYNYNTDLIDRREMREDSTVRTVSSKDCNLVLHLEEESNILLIYEPIIKVTHDSGFSVLYITSHIR